MFAKKNLSKKFLLKVFWRKQIFVKKNSLKKWTKNNILAKKNSAEKYFFPNKYFQQQKKSLTKKFLEEKNKFAAKIIARRNFCCKIVLSKKFLVKKMSK